MSVITANLPDRPKALRYSLTDVCVLLSMSMSALRLMVGEGEFTEIRDKPARKGVPVYLPADEVEAMGSGGIEALRSLRAKKTRQKAKP